MDSIQAGLQMMLDRGELLKCLRAFKRGDFSARMPLNLTGIDGEIAQAFNDVVELEEATAVEISRIAEVVGKDFVMRRGLNYLQKPYHPQRLATVVRDCLDVVN